jgi:hypothetical protein
MRCLCSSLQNPKSKGSRASDRSGLLARKLSDMSRRVPLTIRGKRRTKFGPGTRIVGRREGPPEYRSRSGTVIEYLGASLYRVKFDDKEQKECVQSQWIELNEKFPW